MRALILQAIDNTNKRFNWWATTVLLKYAVIALGVVLYTIVVMRVSDARAEAKYEAWTERFVNDYLSQVEAEKRGMPIDPHEQLLNQQSEAIARL